MSTDNYLSTEPTGKKQRRKLFMGIMIALVAFLFIVIWTLAPHVLKLIGIIFVLAFFAFLIGMRALRVFFKKLRSNWIFALCGAASLSLYLWMCHVSMSDKLKPLEDEFYETALKECKLVYVPTAHYDCDGKLDVIIERRNALLEENGFMCISCKWKIRGTGATISSAYLKFNPLR